MKTAAVQQQDSMALNPISGDSVVVDSTIVVAPKTPFRFSDTDTDVETGQTTSDTTTKETFSLNGPGLFKGHNLRPSHPSALPVNDFTSDWFTISLILLIGLFTWFRVFYNRIFSQLISACFNVTVTNQIVRDESVLLQRASLVLSVISYLLFGLFLYQLSIYFNWQIPWIPKGLVRFAMFAVAVASAYSVKMVFLRFLSSVFDQDRPAALYIFNIFLMVMMTGLVLLPVNILLAYGPAEFRLWIIEITVGLLGLIFLYRLLRATGIWIGIPGFSFFYLFLYLCTCEIAPLLIIYKLTM